MDRHDQCGELLLGLISVARILDKIGSDPGCGRALAQLPHGKWREFRRKHLRRLHLAGRRYMYRCDRHRLLSRYCHRHQLLVLM